MKREWMVAIAIVAGVIVFALVDVGLFLYSGSEAAVWFLVIGLPVVLAGGAVAYVRGALSGPSGGQSRFVKERARTTGDALREFWTKYTRLREDHPEWEPTELEEDIEQLLVGIEGQGISFDKSNASFSLSNFGSPDMGELDRLHKEIDRLESQVSSSFQAFVVRELERLRDQLSKVERVGLASPDDWEDSQPQQEQDNGRIQDSVELLERHYDEAEATLNRAIDTVKELREDMEDVDDQGVERRLDSAGKDAKSRDFESAVDSILMAHDSIDTDVASRAENLREVIAAHLGTIEDSIVDQYVSPGLLDQVEDLRNDLPLDPNPSALEIDKLRSGATELAEISTDMIEEMVDELEEDLETLESADLPPDFYDRPATADSDHVTELRRTEPTDSARSIEELTDLLQTYRSEWMASVGELSTAIDDLSTKATVAETYDEVADTIRENLRRTGHVRPDDLPVREADTFMELYAANHSRVQFEADVPEVSLEGGGEKFDVTVLAQFERGGEEKSAMIQLDGPTDTWEETVRTRVAEEQTFNDLPYGEYTVRIVPDSESFKTVEKTTMVDEGKSIEFSIPERGLRERLCEEVSVNIGEHLAELEGELEGQFSEAGYLTSEMAFGITDDYIPCLVATWAEREGYNISTTDGSGNTLTETSTIGEEGHVVVFDPNGLNEELSTVVEYNLEPGDEFSFEDLRQRFLTAPVPDDVIADSVREQINATGIEVTDTGISKHE